MNFEKVEEYLKTYSMKEPPYDPNGAIHLMKAIVENLRVNFNESDFEDYSGCLSRADEDFLRRLLLEIPRSRGLIDSSKS